jgi:hypothetical protein
MASQPQLGSCKRTQNAIRLPHLEPNLQGVGEISQIYPTLPPPPHNLRRSPQHAAMVGFRVQRWQLQHVP